MRHDMLIRHAYKGKRKENINSSKQVLGGQVSRLVGMVFDFLM